MADRPFLASKSVTYAANALVEKLEEIFSDDQYASVWVMAHNRGAPYTGPNCEKELQALKDALNSAPDETPGDALKGWTTESVLRKHGLWQQLARPDPAATAIRLQWQDMEIDRLRGDLQVAQLRLEARASTDGAAATTSQLQCLTCFTESTLMKHSAGSWWHIFADGRQELCRGGHTSPEAGRQS